jgi:uncharacterized protein
VIPREAEARISAHSARRFLADAMLGRLARWLRAAGFDTAYLPELDDHALVRLATLESRTLLTRDRHLVEHLQPADALLVRSQLPLEQLRQVSDACGLLRPDGLFTRCLVCNAVLDPLPADAAARLLPPRAREIGGPAFRCPGCGRVYWPGSHARRMREALARTIPLWFPPS